MNLEHDGACDPGCDCGRYGPNKTIAVVDRNAKIGHIQKRLIEALQEAESLVGSQLTMCLMDDVDESHRQRILLKWRRLLLDCGAKIENLRTSRWHTPERELKRLAKPLACPNCGKLRCKCRLSEKVMAETAKLRQRRLV